MTCGSSPELRYLLDPAVRAAGIEFGPPREGDAGFDLRSSEAIVIPAGGQALIPTGLKIAVPAGYVGLVRDRSSVASERVYTHAGVIDAAYRGEVKIVVSNGGGEPFSVEPGQKVAQLVVVPCVTAGRGVNSIEELGATSRGENGFGSTGR